MQTYTYNIPILESKNKFILLAIDGWAFIMLQNSYISNAKKQKNIGHLSRNKSFFVSNSFQQFFVSNSFGHNYSSG